MNNLIPVYILFIIFLSRASNESSSEHFPFKILPRAKDPELQDIFIALARFNSDIILRKFGNLNKRQSGYQEILELLYIRKAKVLVETGTARAGDKNCAGDGCSTIIFGYFSKLTNAKLYSVDKSKFSINESRAACKPFANFVELILSDSIAFLENFDKVPIDFLYLDSYDRKAGAKEHYLKEIQAAYAKLHRKSVVMIDDCGERGEGNCDLVLDFLQSKGWKLFKDGFQQIFVYED